MKLKLSSFMALFFCLSMTDSKASFEGLDEAKLKSAPIVSFTRPCCSFSRSFFTKSLGLTKYIEVSKLGKHSYNRSNGKSDKVGMLYSCNGGFIDISHLRDNADWSAHIFYNLGEWLGSGKDVPVKNEDGFKSRSIIFKKLTTAELSTLTAEDKEKVAISVGYSMALLHEMATAFNVQSASSFSVEDAYSNLLGNYLGVKAAAGPLPYNQGMESELLNTMEDLGALDNKGTKQVHKSVMNLWWKGSLFGRYKSVLKRDLTHSGEVIPFQIPSDLCKNTSTSTLMIPGLLSNGKHVNDYYKVHAVLNKHTYDELTKLGAKVGYIVSQDDFQIIVDAIRTKLVKSFGTEIDQH